MDDFTDLMEKALLATARTDTNTPIVAKVARSGTLPEKIFLPYSQERFASYGLKPENLSNILNARNITGAGGEMSASGKNIAVTPGGEFHSEQEIGSVAIGFAPNGAPLYLRDVVDVYRAYDTPPRYLNFYTWRDSSGQWQRSRAITISVQMGAGQQIDRFAQAVDGTLADLKSRLPFDLIIARTSDQPQQVSENIELFMRSLYEAVVLVIVVSLIGFWEWRSAFLMAFSIPITLLMTFGMARLLGIDLQQVSIASLIVALGLLVDDPVVAGDAIKRGMADGHSPMIAAWLGPTKLATAILYATITNIVAYLPFLLLPGSTGQFLYSLPVVIGCSLVASRVSSMTFIPMLGRYLLRPRSEPSMEERRAKGFGAGYYALGGFLIRHRKLVFLASLGVLAAGALLGKSLKQQFFPKDLSYLSYVNIFLPEDAPFSATDQVARQVESGILQVGKEMNIPVQSLTSFIGGSGPRFWYSLAPEPQHLNYAQVIILLSDKHDTDRFLGPLQDRLSRTVAGARIDVRQLETGDAVGLPVAIRISGEDMETLVAAADRAKQIFAGVPIAARPRDDWGEERFDVRQDTDPDRANAAGITNLDVASASNAAMSGAAVTVLREGDKQIPVVARLRMEERAQLGDIQNLYVYGQGGQKVPLRSVSRLDFSLHREVIRRRDQFRTITVSAAPVEGVLASQVMTLGRPKLMELAHSLPPGYRLEIGGEEEKQVQGFGNLATVLVISVACIFLALVFQFKNAVKPFIVFAAVPYGTVGALLALWITNTAFGFMAFLGVISLVGVIVSHIIVLFDFIEEKHAEGEPFVQAVLDAGIMRLRPVMITVGATVIALFPLALHGGPLWEPLCYAQIGGLAAATFITLLLVPVIYSIVVLDLKLVKWKADTITTLGGI
jgi:multidrug efflux pump subunit AcrB